MQLLQLTSIPRNRVLGFVASTLLMLLLAWQLSFKATAIEKTFVGVNQSVFDVTELSVDFNDFDQAIPATQFQRGEFTGWVDADTVVLPATSSHVLVPQSRAPPAQL